MLLSLRSAPDPIPAGCAQSVCEGAATMLDVDARTDGSTQPPPAGRRQLAPQRLVGILKDSSASADVRTATAFALRTLRFLAAWRIPALALSLRNAPPVATQHATTPLPPPHDHGHEDGLPSR